MAKIAKTKKTLLALCFVVVFAPLSNAVFPLLVPQAHALTTQEIQDCYNRYNGQTSAQLDIPESTNPCFKKDTNPPCVFTSNDLDARAVCTNPAGQESNAQTTAQAAAAEVLPLQEQVCGAKPSGQAGYENWAPCANQVQSIYNGCSLVKEGPLAGNQNSDSATASCALSDLNKIANGRKVTQAQATTAINKGRAAAKTILDDANAAGDQKTCEDGGGKWEDGKCTQADGTTIVCAQGALGWLLCPLAKLFIDATNLVADQLQELLIFKPLLVGNNGDAMKAIWNVVLNISNVALVIVFLVVVFSQATSVGLSAYGIKKLLPKLVAAAILVNLSYYICAFGIDVSNILGESVKGIIGAGFDAIKGQGGFNGNTNGPSWLAAFIDQEIAAMAALVVVATDSLPLILPVVAAGVVAFVTAWFIIGLRVVILTLLVVVSPLAFVAWVLPNTAQMFTRWRKLFMGLLLMYPVVMAVFYGAALVSAIILAT